LGRQSQGQSTFHAVFWILRTGSPQRDLLPDYGGWSNTHRRFIRWRDKGIWEKLLEKLMIDPDFEWLMIDATHVKGHPHVAGAQGDNQDRGRSKGGLIPKITWPWTPGYADPNGCHRCCHS
jgi:transposase